MVVGEGVVVDGAWVGAIQGPGAGAEEKVAVGSVAGFIISSMVYI